MRTHISLGAVLALVAFAVSCHTVTGVSPDPATPGSEITITGSSFGNQQGAGEVLYDGEALAVVSWSNTEIVATLPATKADGTYDVTVVSRGESVSIPHAILNPVSGMVLVPGGSFAMGSATGYAFEQPVHTVYLDAFLIDPTEVTVAEYAECVSDGACTAPFTFPYCNWGVAGFDDHPVNCVTWLHADAYCEWVGKRLPTEAEWEKAARGTDERTFPWGDETATCDYAVMSAGNTFGQAGCNLQRTWTVGSKPAGDSPYGVKDMGGNVWEWVADWLDESYYSVSPPSNPTGPATGTYKVIRGGSWISDADFVRSTMRGAYRDYETNDDVGFRCAQNP